MRDSYALEKGVKRLFYHFGLNISKGGRIGKTMRASLDQLVSKGFSPGTVIDVGVGYGTYDLYRSFPQCKIVLIEPLEEFEPELRKIFDMYDADWIRAVASDESGETEIHVHEYHLEGSTLYEEKDGDYDRSVDGVVRKVRAVKIDDIIKEGNYENPFLIKADVQGAELKVLKGAEETLKKTDVVLLEVQFFEFLKGCPQFYDVVAFMKTKGFVAYDVFGGYTRPYDGALAAVDMTFVQENGMFRQVHNFRKRK